MDSHPSWRDWKYAARCMLLSASLLLAACQTSPSSEKRSRSSSSPEPGAHREPGNPTAGNDSFDELDPFELSLDDRELFRHGLVEAEYDSLRLLESASRYTADLHIGSDPSHVQGRLQVRYTNLEDAQLDRIPFRVFPKLFGGEVGVDSIQVQNRTADASWDASGSVLWVDLQAPLHRGETITMGLKFDYRLPLEMSGNYGLYGYFDDVLTLNGFLPLIAVFNEDGWNVDVPSKQGDVSFFDASFFLVRVVAPVELTVVSSGFVVESARLDSQQAYLIAAGPAREFYLAASASWKNLERRVDDLVVHGYTQSEHTAVARDALKTAERALRSFGARLGPYPYRELDLVASPMQALGMEYPGVCTIAENLFDPSGNIQGVPNSIYLESVIVHEIAHQWFYNMVGNDQQDEPWLDEALAQYLTYIYYLDTSGAEAAQAYRQSWFGRWDRVEREQIPIGLPVGAYAGPEYSAIVYGRGPLFIEVLAQELGQASFETFLRSYTDKIHWGIATPEEFRRLAEDQCACDLGMLFSEWIE